MSFYDDMLKASKVEGFSETCEVRVERVDRELDEAQFAGLILDDIFDEFRTMTEWPREKLEFTEPETPVHYESRPSRVISLSKDGAHAVTAIFICGSKQVEEMISLREAGDDHYELKIGQNILPFRLAEMTFCPPFAPLILLRIVGAWMMKAVLKERIENV